MIAWVLWRRGWRWLLVAGLAVALTDPLCARVLKPLAARERPCRVDDAVRTVGDCGSGPSLPSNHAANTAALAASLASPGLGVVALGAGASRVVLGQHWPSDVGLGWLVGAAVGGGLRWFARRKLKWT